LKPKSPGQQGEKSSHQKKRSRKKQSCHTTREHGGRAEPEKSLTGERVAREGAQHDKTPGFKKPRKGVAMGTPKELDGKRPTGANCIWRALPIQALNLTSS